jgi:hypothetical protein
VNIKTDAFCCYLFLTACRDWGVIRSIIPRRMFLRLVGVVEAKRSGENMKISGDWRVVRPVIPY